MDLGIIGLAKSGKTTVFNALTRGNAETTAFGRTGLQPNLGVVKVPEPRLDQLEPMFKPRRVVYAEVQYVDIGGASADLGKGAGFGGPLLNVLDTADALIHVVRTFEDPSIPHPLGSVDPARDIASINLELAYSDASIIERRLERLANTLKAAKPSEREAGVREQEWLLTLKERLEAETPIREMDLSDEQHLALANYALLTAKPLLILLNVGEDQAVDAAALAALEEEHRVKFGGAQIEVFALCGKLEMELASMELEEAAEFRSALGLHAPSMDRVVQASYRLLGLISFFTVGPDENRAWTIRQRSLAPQAAGKIHTDLEKGFIRAEVVPWEQLLEAGGWADARKAGHLRTEGKSYPMQDGDVVNILFSK